MTAAPYLTFPRPLPKTLLFQCQKGKRKVDIGQVKNPTLTLTYVCQKIQAINVCFVCVCVWVSVCVCQGVCVGVCVCVCVSI